MQERLVKGEFADYIPQEYSGINTSGWRPFGNAVLVLLDVAAPTMGEQKVILVTDKAKDIHNLASETGTLIAVGLKAFAGVGEDRPKPGDRVSVATYAGRHCHGHDGLNYRMMTDDCVLGVETDNG